MKKITYILLPILILAVFIQPTKNYLAEQYRLDREEFINDFLAKKQTVSYKDSKKLPKAMRPDLKGAHDYLMMYDPVTKTIPTERMLEAIDFAEQKRSSLMYNNRLSEVNWSERGPNTIGGRTRAIMLDPNDSSNKKLWAAGVTGGLWYTNDITSSSPSWTSVDGTWGNLAVCSINYDPNDPNTMYVGTGERMGIFSTSSRGLGMWKTTDGGQTWSHLTSTENFNYVTDIIVRNESGSSVIYAGVGGHYYEGQWHGSEYTGLWRSTDGGQNWSQVMDETAAGEKPYEIMDLDMGSDNRIWAASRTNVYGDGGGDIFYSDDGLNWTKASLTLLGQPNRTIIAVAPSDPNYVYAMIASTDTRKVNWIVKSTDSGATWTIYTYGTDPFPVDANGNVLGDANGQAGYDLSLGVDPSDPNVVYAGELDIFKTTDGGGSWNQVSNSGGSTYPYMHVDQQNLKTITSNEVIFSNDGGIYYTNDAGVTLSDRNTGYNVSQFYSVALHPDSGSQYVIGGTQDNGTWSIDGTGIQSGNARVGGDGAYTHIDQLDPNYQFTATTYNNIYRSTNGGQSWSYYANHEDTAGGDTGFFINPSTIDPAKKAFYSALDANSILRLNNYANLADKSVMSISLGSTASAFKVSPYTDDVLFVGTSGGRVFKIVKASTSSFSVEEISGSGIQGYISSIDIGASDEQILITVSNYGVKSVWETYGGGGPNGWNNIEGDLPDMPIRWGLYNADNYNQVIVATELGTWVSDDVSAQSPTWYPSNDGLANVRTDMLVRRSADNALAAGTHGRGIFYSTGFTSTAPLNAAFTPNKTAGVFPLTVDFSDRSTGSPTSWNWDFGDGNTSTEQNPSHTFTTSGRYSVSLQVGDGSGTDSVSKTNLIWATAVQDTLWEEGFETNPYGWADGRRDVHAFLSNNANGDADDFSWWYYTAGYGAADGSHWMAGLGMASSGGTADDWLISPNLWLRPGTDNMLSFYVNTNGGQENYNVMLSPTGSTALEDFTVTLDTVEETITGWSQKSYDLSQYAGTKVRVALHITTANQGYIFFDNMTLTAGQLDASGSPLEPQGVIAASELEYDTVNSEWVPTSDGIEILWNRSLETDFASYNVYASQTQGFTADNNTLLGTGTLGNIDSEHFEPSPSTTPWPDTTFVFRQTFGVDNYIHDGLNQGEEWFYRISAVDNDGNETIGEEVSFLLDSLGPTAGTVTINDLVDTSYLRSNTEVSISIDGWSDNTGIETFFMGIGSSGDDTSADVVSYTNVGLTNLQLTGLTLDDYSDYFLKVVARDGAGNLSSFVVEGFTVYTSLLGDLDSDWDVDVEDLNAFVNAWPNAGLEPTVDIGPATGTSPYLMPSFDNTNDINDLSVFSRNWLWTKAQGRTAEDIEIMHTEFEAEILGNQIIIELPEGITAGRFEIGNLENVYDFNTDQKQGYIVLENEDEQNQYYEVEFGNLSSNDNKIVINIDGAPISSDLELSYQLFSKDGMIGNGMMQLRNPDEFNLYQNYPNPFNSQTTIMYDIPSLMVNMVDVEILIYNTLGKLVRTIDEGDKGAGQHTTVWDGKNDDGENVSSGVYFYQLRAKVDGQSDYNKTKKMVIVR